MRDVVLSHPGKVPNAEVASVRDGDLLHGHAVGTFEDHLSEGGGRSLSKETSEEVTFERIDQLCLPDTGRSADEELHSVHRDLA